MFQIPPTLPTAGDLLAAFDTDTPDIRSAWFERRRRAMVMASLGRRRYHSALELGCGTGGMTSLLAARCDSVTACDMSTSALVQAREQLDHAANVRFLPCRLPRDWPTLASPAQLIVLCDMAYYLGEDDARMLAARCHEHMAPGSELVACHGLHAFPGRRAETRAIHAMLGDDPRLRETVRLEDGDFLLQIWRCVP